MHSETCSVTEERDLCVALYGHVTAAITLCPYVTHTHTHTQI